MRKLLSFLLIALLVSSMSFAQLTGIKTIPGDYASIAAAIADLNVSGAGTGGVTFNVAAGHVETFPTSTSGRITTLTGSASNPIVFQKSGEGANPKINAASGVGGLDAIITFDGCDYVTFDGIDLLENPANTNSLAWMEWGYAVLKRNPTNGAQNITIKNCYISLKRDHTSSIGIYSNNHTSSNSNQLNVTNVSGTNSYLKLSNNTITNVYWGIYISGFGQTAPPYQFYDQGCEVGNETAGNTITNFAGGTSIAYGIHTIYQNNLKVANNTVSGSIFSSSYPFIYGIYLNTANNASFDLFGNTVSLLYRPTDLYGNSRLYGIYSSMGANGTNNTANIYNNTVTNCNYPTANGPAEANYMVLLNLGVTANIYGNVVSNNTTGSNLANTNGTIRYIWIQKLSSNQGQIDVYDNIVSGNKRIQPTPEIASTFMLSILGNGTVLNANNNLIDNNIVASIGSTQILYVTFNDSQSKNIFNNTVSNISEANGSVNAIYNGNGTFGRFYNNKIYNIKSGNSNPQANISGIYMNQDGASMYIYNNMISDLAAPSSDATLGYDWTMLNGIYLESSTNVRGIYNNTIYLNATITGTQTNFGSSAITAFSLYGIDMKNNILINTSASKGPNGKTVALRARSTGFLGFTANFNNLYAGTPGASNQIFTNGTQSAQTLAAYKTLLSPQELQSVTEMSPFVNITTTPYDLRMKTTNSTQCESGGSIITTPVDISTDQEGTPRYPNPGYPTNLFFSPNAPDIGADEFGGVPTDLIPPQVTLTPLPNTSNNQAKVLEVTIVDGTGVPTSGIGLPRLYWRINSAPYQGVAATYVSGNTYTFTFGQGTVLNDVVSYYIVAQDLVNTPNVGATPSLGAGGFSINPPACTTPPTTPFSFKHVLTIAGVFHVGVGKDYTTLTAAVNDLNAKLISGPVTFILHDNNYPNETFPINLFANGGSSAVNTLTIKPNTGANPVISGSLTGTGILRFIGFSHAVIDGSNNGTNSRNLTFSNVSSQHNSFVISVTTNPTGESSTNITLKNTIISGNIDDITKETYLVVLGQFAGINMGGYNNILIHNNWLKRAKTAMDIYGGNTKRNQNITISNNTIGSADPLDYITRVGIYFRLTNNMLISGNEIMGPADGSDAVAQIGLGFSESCTNIKITGNKIHSWVSNGMGSIGIKCDNNDISTPTEISNNEIYNIGAWGLNPGVALSHAQGITVRQGGNIRIWNNSIYLSGPYLFGFDSYAPSSTCIAFWNQSAVNSNTYDVRNNILRNAMTNPYPNPGPDAQGKAYCIMMTDKVSNYYFDNNDYYPDGHQGHIGQVYGTGGLFMNFYPTLADWQGFTGADQNSVVLNPLFTSETFLLPTSIPLNNLGAYIPQVTVDITGAPRSNPPDMGAYEFGTAPLVHNISIPAGWSGVSSYLKPNNPSMASVLSPIMNNLDILYNFNGMYYPGGNIYTLVSWNEYDGYAIKVNQAVTLPIGPLEIGDKTVALDQGWNFIPVLSPTNYSVTSLFNGVNGFAMAKDVAGVGVYWPAYGINTIGNVLPGKAYYVRMDNAGSINYNPFKANPVEFGSSVNEPLLTPWNAVTVTPASHLVLFIFNDTPMMNGDIIGGFTAEGLCAGAVEITDPTMPFTVNMNGDDNFTTEKDGFATSNPLYYKLYRPSTGETFDLAVTYSPGMNQGYFEHNGVSVINSVTMSATGVTDPFATSLTIYPNPSKGAFTITGISNDVNVSIFNAFGDEIYSGSLNLPATLNLTGQPKGFYFARFETAAGVYFEKLVIN